jgi:hypothetical protein
MTRDIAMRMIGSTATSAKKKRLGLPDGTGRIPGAGRSIARSCQPRAVALSQRHALEPDLPRSERAVEQRYPTGFYGALTRRDAGTPVRRLETTPVWSGGRRLTPRC